MMAWISFGFVISPLSFIIQFIWTFLPFSSLFLPIVCLTCMYLKKTSPWYHWFLVILSWFIYHWFMIFCLLVFGFIFARYFSRNFYFMILSFFLICLYSYSLSLIITLAVSHRFFLYFVSTLNYSEIIIYLFIFLFNPAIIIDHVVQFPVVRVSSHLLLMVNLYMYVYCNPIEYFI